MNFSPNVNNQIFRKDYPVILALNAHLATILPVLLAYNASGYKAGQVLAFTSGSSGSMSTYSSVSGSQTAQCILLDEIPSEQFIATTGQAMGRGVFTGQVYQNNLIDYNSTVATNLGGRTLIDAQNVPILKF